MPERRRLATASSRRLAALARSRARLTEDEPGTARQTRRATPPAGRPVAPPRPGVWRRIGRAALHPGRSQVVAAVVLCLLGMAGVMQIRANDSGDAYRNARREDLVQILDGLGVESRRLEAEVAELQGTKARLQSGADSQRVAREDAQQRVDELAILAGTAPAQGPGIRMRISDPQDKVDADVRARRGRGDARRRGRGDRDQRRRPGWSRRRGSATTATTLRRRRRPGQPAAHASR